MPEFSVYQNKRKAPSRRTYGILLFAYALITLISVFYHEPWRDEAFVWLMARDLSASGLFHELRYNGSPGLWHALVAVLAKSGLPYESQQYMHWLLACFTVGIFLFYAPFNILLKTAFLFSYFMLHQYSVITRVYLISITLMFVVCALYKERKERPLLYGGVVALLANTNVFGLFAATLFGADYLWETWKQKKRERVLWISLLIMVVGGLIAVVTVMPANDGMYYYTRSFPFFHPIRFAIGMYAAFYINAIEFVAPTGSPFWQSAPGVLGIIFGASIYAAVIVFLAKKRAYKALTFLLLCSVWVSYLMVVRYVWASSRHYGFYLIFSIVALWLAHHEKGTVTKEVDKLIFGFLFMSLCFGVVQGISSAYIEIYGPPFSGSKEMARYIREQKLTSRPFVGYSDSFVASTLPYLPEIKPWFPTSESYGTYVHFDGTRKRMTIKDALEMIPEKLNKNPQQLFLFSEPVPKSENNNFKLLYDANGVMEHFWLYERKANQ